MKDQQSILDLVPEKQNYSYVTNREDNIPMAAVLDDGTMVPSTTGAQIELQEKMGVSKKTKFHPIVAACITEHTTTENGNHGAYVTYPGEKLGLWVHKVEERHPSNNVKALLLRHHKGTDGGGYIYEGVQIDGIDYEKLRRKCRDALNKTTDKDSLLQCSLILNVKL